MKKKSFMLRFLLWLDQGGNVIFMNGSEDETISSHCWVHREKRPWAYKAIDKLFLFLVNEKDHCKNSFEADEQ